MSEISDNTYDLYNDIKTRTNGEIYIGVVGPVRSGKSTFIKRFMEQLVIPGIDDENERKRAIDELPQSGDGKTIMTTEPKFVPQKAVKVRLKDDTELSIRLIDCVGYVISGATGYIEDFKERMVKTPWFDEDIPFTEAAHIGTEKVIREHSTIGIVVTSDGTVGEIERANYEEGEAKAIDELKSIGKPFVVILNTIKPYSPETKKLADDISIKHKVTVLPVNCAQLKAEDITNVLSNILYEFHISEIAFNIPKWADLLEEDNDIMKAMLNAAKTVLYGADKIRDIIGKKNIDIDCPFIESILIKNVAMDTGVIDIFIKLHEKYFFETLSRLTNTLIENEYQLVNTIKELSGKRKEVDKLSEALANVQSKGYGFVTANKEDIELDEPELIKNGNKFGVKITAKAPSIHMINAAINTQISPIVGTQKEAEDLIQFIKDSSRGDDGIWQTNIFGKTIEQIVESGINEKIHNMSEENIEKIRETLQKVMNENSGLVCFIV